MWQRIQTLYMAIALVIIGIAIANVEYVPFIILLSIGAAANLIPLFCFKHRMLQLRILIFGAVVLFCLQVWMGWQYFTTENTGGFNYATVVPIIAVILDVLAARGVFSDELIVRSSDRLRAAKRKKK